MADSLYEVGSLRYFAGLALNDDRIVDERGHLREQGYPLSLLSHKLALKKA